MADEIPASVYEDAARAFYAGMGYNQDAVERMVEAYAERGHFRAVVESAYRAGQEHGTQAMAAKLWRAANLLRGKCRYCRRGEEPSAEHRMTCQHYVGPLEHRWVHRRINETFGGLDHFCSCGGWFRQGGTAGHGDGSEAAEPICPDASAAWRGPLAEVSGETKEPDRDR